MVELWVAHVIFKVVEIVLLLVAYIAYALSYHYNLGVIGYWGPGPAAFVFLIILILCIDGLYIEFWEAFTLGAFVFIMIGESMFTSYACGDVNHERSYCSGYALGAMHCLVGLGLGGYLWTLICFALFPVFDVGPEQRFHFALTILWIVTALLAALGLIYWGILSQWTGPYVAAVFACVLAGVFIADLIIVQRMY